MKAPNPGAPGVIRKSRDRRAAIALLVAFVVGPGHDRLHGLNRFVHDFAYLVGGALCMARRDLRHLLVDVLFDDGVQIRRDLGLLLLLVRHWENLLMFAPFVPLAIAGNDIACGASRLVSPPPPRQNPPVREEVRAL